MNTVESDRYNLQKHPELFYLSDNRFHICTQCFKMWKCLTIQNYGVHDHSELVEKCYECENVTYAKSEYVKPYLDEDIWKKMLTQLVISHLENKRYARSRGAITT
jgi:hypothetical protein